MRKFLEGFLNGHIVWLFGSIFMAFILCFISKDMPNGTAAGWFVAVFGTSAAVILQAWYHKEYETDMYDWFHAGMASIVFIFAGIIRCFMD